MARSSNLKASVKAKYKVVWQLAVELELDTTKGRSVENYAADIEEELLNDGEFWDGFPAITNVSLSSRNIKLLYADN